jgi:hypothetical protein
MVQKRAKLPVFTVLLLILVIIVVVFEGAYFWLKVKKNQETTPNPPLVKMGSEYLVEKQIDTYNSSNDEARIGYIITGKKFVVLEEKDNWLKIQLIMPDGKPGATGWIKVDDTAYKIASEK